MTGICLDIRGYSAARRKPITKRRSVLRFAGATLIAPGAVLLPGNALSQTAARKSRVLVLHSAPIRSGPYHGALKERLATHGFIEGKNLVLDAPLLEIVGFDFVRQSLAKMLKQTPDALFTFTPRITDSALAEAPNVPLVFVWVDDPVKAGLVKDYSRPGGKATGVTNRFAEVAGKRLELLRELAPKIRRVAVVGPLYQPEGEAALATIRPVAQRLAFELIEVSASFSQLTLEIQHAIRGGAEAVLPFDVFSMFGIQGTGEEVVRLCAAHRVPAIFAESEMVEVGALVSYGTNLVEDVRRGADMLAKILRGTKPADIPVDQASQFELAVNLKTARQMKIRVPPTVLARASRVIE
jgi:putative ABC transport system substrate-binding protein